MPRTTQFAVEAVDAETIDEAERISVTGPKEELFAIVQMGVLALGGQIEHLSNADTGEKVWTNPDPIDDISI